MASAQPRRFGPGVRRVSQVYRVGVQAKTQRRRGLLVNIRNPLAVAATARGEPPIKRRRIRFEPGARLGFSLGAWLDPKLWQRWRRLWRRFFRLLLSLAFLKIGLFFCGPAEREAICAPLCWLSFPSPPLLVSTPTQSSCLL